MMDLSTNPAYSEYAIKLFNKCIDWIVLVRAWKIILDEFTSMDS